MKEAPIATQADLNDQATLAQDTPPAAQEATPAFTNLGEFYTWARTIGYPTVKDRMDVPGVAEAIEAKDYAKAAELLVAAKEQAKKAG